MRARRSRAYGHQIEKRPRSSMNLRLSLDFLHFGFDLKPNRRMHFQIFGNFLQKSFWNQTEFSKIQTETAENEQNYRSAKEEKKKFR
jgi:hypothetical protein